MLSTGWRWTLLVSLLCGGMACAPVFAPEVRSQVDPTLSYADLLANPAAHVGRIVLLGGTIVDATNFETTTQYSTRLDEAIGNGPTKPRADAF